MQPIGDKYREYGRMKHEFYVKYGHVDPREYDAWIDAVVEELGI
jgi:hypothetical protein